MYLILLPELKLLEKQIPYHFDFGGIPREEEKEKTVEMYFNV